MTIAQRIQEHKESPMPRAGNKPPFISRFELMPTRVEQSLDSSRYTVCSLQTQLGI